ncbi:hypothetical protein AJ78_05838 [Emergomyces pasteurianus Ep9510]|uniref:Magnesium and cobalt transporter CorA n=1 Tax=Emergomyces pasteurianus Ep9510 TaxID=1447872 RepID=A0A1J9PCF3_9EURO|nr:hypothetical protein AJ78_05838 [Emergomyces pasteurianus Ep9510]
MDPSTRQAPRQGLSRPPSAQPTSRSSANSCHTDAGGTTQEQPRPGPEPLVGSGTAPKKRKHRGHRRRRHRRPSFAPPVDTPRPDLADTRRSGVSPEQGDGLESTGASAAQRRDSIYRLGQLGPRNLSETSLDSDVLLDHRRQPMMRPRRESRLAQAYRPEPQQLSSRTPERAQRPTSPSQVIDGEESEEADDRTPLIKPSSVHNSNFVRYGTSAGTGHSGTLSPKGRTSATSSFQSPTAPYPFGVGQSLSRGYDVNNPPSVPGSPHIGAEGAYDDPMIAGHDFDHPSPEIGSTTSVPCHIIDVDGERHESRSGSSAASPRFTPPELQRRRTVTLPVEDDVCFPTGALSDLAEEDFVPRPPLEDESGAGRRRRRRRVWPDLSVLEEWSREEKEERSGGIRAKKINEPVLIGGRLRPQNTRWVREEEDTPYRFTYFNEEFQSTIHSQTILELLQPGQTFRDLFIPDPPEIEDDSSDESDHPDEPSSYRYRDYSMDTSTTNGYHDANHQRGPQNLSDTAVAIPEEKTGPSEPSPMTKPVKEKRYGPRPTFWLDVLCPTDTEMRVISKAFGIHALTAEDIMVQEAREKVELFRHYYFINYRTFEQDVHSDKYLEPVNMYVVVFREGVISFHFSMIPHPANVRRRIRQLKDYLILSADWISYAIIDDITDVFGPLIQFVENEVDDIDDTILQLHSDEKLATTDSGDIGDGPVPSGSDMLRRVGECRKKVMSLYRLLGNKADVIKGFAKRCNEQWEVAPKSEIGLYLGDIQDHIVTMTSNLSHYETLLSRAHSNYLAQINIRMNERQEKTADVLGKLTVLGTIVLPMNIICGMWGMNVKVPGQDIDNLYWFWSITAGLVVFAVACFYIAKRVYGIV